MHQSSQEFEVWLNVFESHSNVVFLTLTEVVVGSFSFAFDRGEQELQRQQDAFFAAAASGQLPYEFRPEVSVPFGAIQKVRAQGQLGAVRLEYRTGNNDRQIRFTPGLRPDSRRFHESLLNRLGQGWKVESQSQGRFIPVMRDLGLLLAAVLITIVCYYGVSTGIIDRAPAWLAMIINFIGPVGIIIVGGLFATVFVLMLVMDLIKPVTETILTRDS